MGHRAPEGIRGAGGIHEQVPMGACGYAVYVLHAVTCIANSRFPIVKKIVSHATPHGVCEGLRTTRRFASLAQ
eukprot:8972435-Alexandrium_andersonii.AAC.1